MSRKLAFKEFDHLLNSQRLAHESLVDYVEFDDQAAVPRLVFRADALIDEPPDAYDVDRQVYRYERSVKRQAIDADDVLSVADRVDVVAEGDSWFNLPKYIRPPAIADQLEKRRHLRVNNIAYWGHTLARILSDREHLDELTGDTKYFLISAGGNDLQNGLESGEAIHEYDPDRPLHDYLTDEGMKIFERIHDGYVALLTDVTNRFPSLKILTHGYDYPRPQVGNGKYIGRYLRRKGIPDELAQNVIDPMMDLLNTRVADASAQFSAAEYLNCRGVTSMSTWFDDMHPGKEGFASLADVFDAELK